MADSMQLSTSGCMERNPKPLGSCMVYTAASILRSPKYSESVSQVYTRAKAREVPQTLATYSLAGSILKLSDRSRKPKPTCTYVMQVKGLGRDRSDGNCADSFILSTSSTY